MAVLSASSFAAMKTFGNTHQYFVGHLVRVLIGILCALAAWRIPLSAWRLVSVPLYLVSVLLVLLTAIPGFPLAPAVNGSSRWLVLGSFRIMPSDLVRFSYILMISTLTARGFIAPRKFSGVLFTAGTALLPAALVILQPDFAGAAYLLVMMVVMLYFAESRFRHMAVLFVALACLGAAFVLTSGYRVERVRGWLDQEAGVQEENFQPQQACIAIGSGGLLGRGLGRGRQQRGFLPEAFSDFILAVIGEETGFVGTTVLISAFIALALLGWRIAERADDTFGSLAAAGLTASIAIGALLNIGVATRLLPTTGMTLPLISWGGTSIFMTLAGIGVIARISGGKAS